MSATLADVGRGFVHPVAGAQQVFRALLDAVARPGRIQAVPAAALAGLDDCGLGRARAAVLLMLLDVETTAWLAPPLQKAARVHLGFHTGVRFAGAREHAAFVVLDASHATDDLWTQVRTGTDLAPQDGSTLIIEVPSLARGRTLSLRGPGIATAQRLRVEGPGAGFWQARGAVERLFPRGVELILTCGDRLAAIPRSTRVTLED